MKDTPNKVWYVAYKQELSEEYKQSNYDIPRMRLSKYYSKEPLARVWLKNNVLASVRNIKYTVVEVELTNLKKIE